MTTKVSCPKCRQEELILGEGDPHCACGHTGTAAAVADGYVEGFLGKKRATGEEWPVAACPECSRPTLVVQVEEVGCPAFVCFSCGAAFEEDDLARDAGGAWRKT